VSYDTRSVLLCEFIEPDAVKKGRKGRLRSPDAMGILTKKRLPRCRGAARDEDGDGFYEMHVNTMERFWSLLRS